MGSKRWLVPVAVVGLIVVTGLAPAAAQTGGSVPATVTMAAAPEACLMVEDATINFGEYGFGQYAFGPHTEHHVTSCSDGQQDLLVAGTDAVSTTSAATWSLVDGSPGHNDIMVEVEAFEGTTSRAWVVLSTTPKLFTALQPHEALDPVGYGLQLPPEGSDGAGETMSLEFLWTAVLSDSDPASVVTQLRLDPPNQSVTSRPPSFGVTAHASDAADQPVAGVAVRYEVWRRIGDGMVYLNPPELVYAATSLATSDAGSTLLPYTATAIPTADVIAYDEILACVLQDGETACGEVVGGTTVSPITTGPWATAAVFWE